MLQLGILRVHTLGDLETLGVTPGADPWIAEVEEFAHGEGARSALLGTSMGLLVYEDGRPVGIAFVKDHDRFPRASLIQAFLLGHVDRGRKLAQPALRAVLAAQMTTDRSHIMWLVHPDNTPMQVISLAVAHDVVRGAGEGGYDVFIFDR